MRAVLLVVGAVMVGAIFALFEPARASATPVTPDDVCLVSEERSEVEPGRTCILFNSKGNGKMKGRYKGYGAYGG